MSLVRQYKHWTLLLYHALRAPTIQIYMKSPSVVAGQDISGTVVIQHYQSTVFGVTVNVIGKEGKRGMIGVRRKHSYPIKCSQQTESRLSQGHHSSTGFY